MNAEEHDEVIRRAKEDLSQVVARMEEMIPSFIDAVSSGLSEWATQTIERTVTSNPGQTTALGKENLGAMKTRFMHILAAFPAATESGLQRDHIWPHRSTVQMSDDNIYSLRRRLKDQNQSSLYDAMRDLVGDIGQLLHDYNYRDELTTNGGWMQVGGRSSGIGYSFRGVPITHLGGSEIKIERLKKEYGEAIDQLVDAVKKLAEAESAKASSGARSLWDEV